MKQTKKLLALLLAVLLTLSVCLTGCGKKESAQPETTQPETEATEAPAEGTEGAETSDPLDVPDLNQTPAAAHHTNAYGYPSYSVHYAKGEDGIAAYTYMNENGELVNLEEADVQAQLDRVVATCGSQELTNRDLAFYFDYIYNSIVQAYSSYIFYIMDMSAPLDEQQSIDGSRTWQQMILDNSLSYFYSTAALYQQAEEHNFTLSAETQAELDGNLEALRAEAEASGVSEEDLQTSEKFLSVASLAGAYYTHLTEGISYTKEDLNTYYDNNAASLQQSGIQKIDKKVMNVRHILLSVEDGADESVWAAKEAEAQALLDQWAAGEATEDSFAALANEHSTDPGSNTKGGLYQDVFPGQMVQTFDAWCFEDGRQPGDTGIVKTNYGFHIMYYVSEGSYVYWEETVAASYVGDVVNAMLQDILVQYPTAADYGSILILDPTAPTAPAPAEETESNTAAE